MEQGELLNHLTNFVLYRKIRKIKTGMHMERIIRILSIQLIDLKRHGAEMLGKLVM